MQRQQDQSQQLTQQSQQSSQYQQTQYQQSQQRVSRMETRQFTTHQTVQEEQVHMSGQMQPSAVQQISGFGPNAAPPIFEKVFQNARFAQGGNATFDGRVTGKPQPTVVWTRKGAPLRDSAKHRISYNEQSGDMTLSIFQIGPGDEGEYTCTARNQYGEAVCSVFIQPEGFPMPQQQAFQKTFKSSEQKSTSSSQGSSYQKHSEKTSYSNGITEEFRIDTFEYRLLREVSYRESITRRYSHETDSQISTTVERSLGPPAPPQISQKPRNSKLLEGSDAVFSAKVAANPRPRLSWFKDGQRVAQSQKHEINYSNNQATLRVKQASSEDSGHYTLLAENPQGCVVSSAYLAIEPVTTQEGLLYEPTFSGQPLEEPADSNKTLAPNFVRVCGDRDVTEGKMTRFDCRVTGRPYPEVTWYINGRQVIDDHNHKILVNESGNHALMITTVGRNDSGVVTCVARNKSGETSFQCNLNVIEKEQVVAPKFVERFTTTSVKDGEPVVLHARAVGTPTPRITWQKDGVPVTPSPDIRITSDGGASTLDISRAKASDAAWYQCTAQNVAGSTATRARLFVEIPQGPTSEPWRLHLPRPTKVIEPEPELGPEIIYLKHVAPSQPYLPRSEEDRVYPPPQFIIPLRDAMQIEGGKVHFEARIEPVGDPTMQVEWFVNGKSLEASSRATTIFRFGFIALDLLSISMRDSGEYVCRVTSATGCVESHANLSVTPRASIERTSQHPDSLQYIQNLEDYSKYQRTDSLEETTSQKPHFIRPLQNLGELQEGRNAHFEAQLTPVSDPTMKVEWYKDGRPITASSRISTIFNFGYVSLNIMHLRAEDAGQYTVRAINRMGEAISSATLNVFVRSTVTGDLGIPEQQRYIEKVEQLEAYQQQQHHKYVQETPESLYPPEFKTPIKDQHGIREGGFAHFEARLEPTGDSTLKVEWLKDGRPVEASSRITTFFNFGYVALTIKAVTIHDVGNYSCRAYNALGQAVTTAQLSVVSKKDIIMETQHPGGLEKIQHLEDTSRYNRKTDEEVTVTQKPRFLGPLKGTNKIVEGQRAHFEARVEPQNDSTMKLEWYFNGKLIQSANRIQTYHDFGYVALDILSVREEDSGTYTVVARNALGEAQLSASMVVETRSSIDTRSMHRGAYEKTQRLEKPPHVEPQYDIEELCKSKPIFVVPLSDPQPLSEGRNVHLECRLEPMGDPTMRVEWFCNGRPITVGSRFRTYYDFGFVALDIIHATALDSGEYTVRATNQLGSAHTSACVRVIDRSDILTETQHEQSLEQIQMLEDSARHQRHATEDVTVMQAPQFTRPLHNIETIEGTNVHMECRLQPVGDSTMKVAWFVNGRPIKVGHRFRPAYDFDYVALDLLSVYPEDSGVYTCQARNQLGEAVTSCSVKVMAKKDLLLESQHPGGLEKIQYLEDASRYKRSDHVDEVISVKPRFVTKPKSLDNMREAQHAHFECKLEPVTDSNLKVEWYKNGRPITIGHRFRPIHDFGYVALDVIDLIAEDSGTYTCRAVNLVGADEVNCTLDCRSTRQIITETQNEEGLEKIHHLEDRTRYHRTQEMDETTTQAPIFTTSLKNIEIKEGQRAHFECRLIPVSDPTMKVEWFHNNQPLKSGSRFTETNNFGFVALDILYTYPEDSGTYTCRAINALGEAVTSSACIVHSKKSIYLESVNETALERIHELEDHSRHHRSTAQEEYVSQAPVFTMPIKDLRVAENQAAHFEARLIPVGDSRLKVEWLRNGVAIQASNRIATMHDFGYVALNLKYVNPEDSGTYTCRAVNDLGEAVTSATLAVQSKAALQLETQHEGALQKLRQLEDSTKYQRREEEDVVVTQPPRFSTQLNGPTDLVEGQSAHYECRIEPYPDPTLKVEWFHNGKPLTTGHRFRTAYDFGFASLDVLTVYGEDSGEYTCRATNRLGHAQSSIVTKVTTKANIIRDTQHEGALQKIQYLEDDSRYKRVATEDALILEKPQFGKSLKNIENLPEGASAHLEATLTPVNDPTMKVEWFCNGRPIQTGHRFKTTYDFGYVSLDILYAYAEDSGTYMCKARNAVGEAVTTSSVNIIAKSGLHLETLDEQRLKKIRELENYERPQRQEVEAVHQRPVFLTPLTSLENLKEGEHAHLETRVEPIHDENLKIEWFVNGVKLKTGHRFRTTHDFGYVALDILYAYPEDSGTYICKATNLVGEAVNTCTIKVGSHRSILLDTHHPEGLQKIRELEAQGRPTRLEVEEPEPTPPRLVTDLRGTTHVYEGQTAHFEAQVEPIHDPNLRIEFYHNGKPLPSASRFHITFDFGYIALDIGHCVPEDAGEYSVKAINNLGECKSSIHLKVTEKGSIILDSQRPEGLEKIRQLEEHVPYKRPEIDEPQTRQRPVFTQPLQNIDSILEAQTAHFECRLIPVGDPTLKVEWFRNEKPIEDSSRITKVHDFGFVSLDITHVRDEDQGVYMCRASNPLGEAVTTASMKIKTKASIQLETQHEESLKRIQMLEQPLAPRPEQPDRFFEKPVFTQLLTGPTELWEGQHAHFEARVVPVGDPHLRFEWYVNGVELKLGSRLRVAHDFGFVTLDIMATVPEDSGVYTCKAINKSGEAVSSISMKVKSRSHIMRDALQPDAWEKIQLKEAEMNKVPEKFIDTTPQQAPVFTTHLLSYDKLVEGQHVFLEAQVEPRADPNLRIEWFKNGISLTTGTRLKSTFDFGHVTMSINSVRGDDSAIYTCKATNLLGEAVSTCTLKIEDKHWLLGHSLHPGAIPKLEALERPAEDRPLAPEATYDMPIFISHLNNVECTEGDKSHFECQVEPSKDPTMKIEWFVNGKPLPSGSRYKSTYDFGFISLDITHTYEEDSGVYTCKATNSKGSASTSGSLRCTSKQNIYLDTQHPQGKAGFDKVQEMDDQLANKYQRQASGPDSQYPKPIWTIPLNPEFKLMEGQPLHLEGTVEPKEDPNLKIEWFVNGKSLDHGSRFKLTSDFGFVTLDLTDIYERDQGIYTCKASNKAGEAFTSTTIYCTTKSNLIERTQHPKGKEGLERIQDLEDSLQRGEAPRLESEEGHAPVFTSEFTKLVNLSEGEIAHFEAGLTPIGDQTMVVEWFYNGKTIAASHRLRTVHAFGMVVLEVLGTKIEDSGTYTCRATNKWGQAEQSVTLECVDKLSGQKPKFTTHIKDIVGLKDGQAAHFECTVIPTNDPNLKIEWFHNGQPILHSSRIKMVSDFGFVVMDISYIQNHDSGEYVCRAHNKYGEDFTRATISAHGRSGVFTESLQPDSLAKIRELESLQGQQQQAPSTPVTEPPKFITQIQEITRLVEGQSAHFEARLTPVTDPDLVVEWYYNGRKLPHGHRYRTFHDFGIVILDILYCYEENSGLYECRAYNKYGEDSTKATMKCISKANLILDSQLPRGMEGGLEKIQTLEDSHIKQRSETVELKGKAPVFTVPLSNIDSLREGENAHFEGRLIPTDDPKLKVEWFWNGKPLRTGSRFRTFHDFGFVILEISPVYPEDSGEYSCRAFNEYGEAVTTASMKVQGKRSIILESQLPKGMEGTIDRIAELEGLGIVSSQLVPDEDSGKPPEFITTPADLMLSENSLAHFECRLIPVNDPSMRVEWFHNGKALWAGSRIKTINDFGFVILEIAGIYQRDGGLYTCKATNRHGEATVSCKLQVRGRQGIILEPQLPTKFRSGTESIQKLEEILHKKEEILAEEEKPNPPRFVVEIKDNVDVPEGGPIHFDCKVEPSNDPTMRIDWFHNGRPFATGSRVHQINDFGFIALDMDYSYSRDAGEYICRATNKWGSCITKAVVTCTTKQSIDTESQLPSGMSAEKLKELEKGGPVSAGPKEDVPMGPPKFVTQIQSVAVDEAESIHFECRVEPKEDPRLRIEWYRNGKPLPMGHRFRNSYDMGFVLLDILQVYSEDSGEYVCRAVNDYGEDFTKANVSCKKLPNIILQNQVPKGMKRSETLMQMEAAIKKYTSEVHLTEDDLYDVDKKQPPRFVTQILDQTELVEMQTTKFECQLAPVGDPNMKVEWFLNGKPLPHKNRFTPIYDFGYVAMNFGWIYPEDSGEYLCRATNLYGMDETRAIIKTAGRPGIIYDSQLPKGMKSIEKIRELEAAWQVVPEEPEEDTKPRTAPVFVSKPEPCTVEEGEWARFCCRVTGHPRPRVMWLINGNTVVNGSRYKLTYDGMYHMDIPKTRQYDTGHVQVIARSSVGEAVAESELKVIPRHDDYRKVLKNAPRRIVGTKDYRKPEWVTHMEELQVALQAARSVPTFVQEIKDIRTTETETVTFECVFSGTPTPDIVWYLNNKAIRNTERVKIRIQENKTTCTITEVTKEDVGTYSCKALSDAGVAITKAKLHVQEIPEQKKKEILIKKAQEEKEKVKKERVVVEKTIIKRRKGIKTTEEETKPVGVEEVQVIETTEEIEEITDEKAKAKPVIPIQEPISLEATASCKKIDEEDETFETLEQKAKRKLLPHESLFISDVQPSDSIKDLEETTPETDRATSDVKQTVSERATVTEVKLEDIIERVEKIIIKEELKMAKEVSEMLNVIKAKDFGPGEHPLRELAEIGYLMKTGVTVNEITVLYNENKFPSLKTPHAQSALVSVVERKGHSPLISEVLTEETTSDEGKLAATVGFKAFMKMIEFKYATVEEIITQFSPDDFIQRAWETSELTEDISKTGAIHTVTVTEKTEVHFDKRKTSLKTVKESADEEAATLRILRKSEDVIEEDGKEYEEGDIYFSISTYTAEADQAMDLVEGERVFILENDNPDWWLVKKNLTQEKGWVPAHYLLDEQNYAIYLQKKLNEKIDKLPVFEKPNKGQEAVAPRFIEKLRPQHTRDGLTIQFECQVEGTPRPQITWFRQTAIIKPSQDFAMYYDEDNVATLIIKEVFPEDAGTFTCVAKNSAGFASSTTELIIELPLSDHGSDTTGLSRKSLSRESSLADIVEGIIPMFAKKPTAQCVDEGTDVVFEGRLVAIPEPDIVWYFNGKPLIPKENITITKESDMHMYSTTLTIKRAKKTQEGVYEIRAKNREGEATVQVLLKVETTDEEAPQVIESLKSLIVKTEETVVLSTKIVGNPAPIITWFKDNKEITKPKPKKEGNTYSITITKTTKEDTAEYTVKAKNPLGTAETTAQLTVEDDKAEPPLFMERFQGVTVTEKGTIRLLARVTGNPRPEVYWLRNNEPLKPNSRTKLTYEGENIELVITDANSETDSGDYKCIATNRVGKASHGARITVDVETVKFTKKLKKTVEITEQETLNLECETSHTVATKWFHNDEEISGMDHRVVIQEAKTHKLVIKKSTMKDAGNYKCTVKNQKTESTVIVNERKPEFVRKLQDMEVKEKEVTVLEVEVSSDTADVVWQKDGQPIPEEEDKFKVEKNKGIRKLIIRSTSIHDEGEYTCALPTEQCTADVTVVELPPEIITKMVDQTVTQGERAMFEIELTKGDALVRWFKDGKELQFSEHIQLSIDGKRQKLKIYNSEMEDKGVYSCQVGDQKSSAKLTVKKPPLKFIRDLPQLTMTPPSTDVTLVVELNRGDVEVEWLRRGRVIEETTKYTIMSDNTVKKLIIHNVKSEDEVEYSCRVEDLFTMTKVEIEIIETPPKLFLDDEHKVYRIRNGENVTFNIKYTATPKPTSVWTVNETLVLPSRRHQPTIDEESVSLTIRRLENEDNGKYKIKLSNTCGEASAELTLYVIDVPSKPGTPELVEVTDTSITLHWKAPESDGNTPIKNYIIEYKDRETREWTRTTETITSTTHKLTTVKTNKEYTFRIIAENEVGPSEPSKSSDYILIKTPTAKEAPTILESLKDVRIGLKAYLKLSCVITGNPQPEITWYKDGKVIKSINITYENNVAKYVMSETRDTTSGIYTVRAQNEMGTAETRCEVVIEEAPKLQVDESLLDQTLKVNEEWKIVFKVSGYPQPDITWKKNNKVVTSTKHTYYLSDEITTKIVVYSLDRDDTATYTVIAENSAGSAEKEIKLRVVDKPTPPQDLQVKSIDEKCATLTWNPPLDDGGLELTKYQLEKYEITSMQWTKVADIERTVSSYTIQELKTNAEYIFRIYAQNPIGKSDSCETETVSTKSRFNVPSPPRAPLEVTGMSATSFTINWQASSSDGGSSIIEYIVEIKESSRRVYKKLGATKGAVTNFAVNYLETGQGYNFKITARNSVGLSEPFLPDDTIIAGSRITPPTCPRNLRVLETSAKSASIEWKKPENDGGSEITGYVIEKKFEYMPTWEKVQTIDASTLSYTFENLKEKTKYVFRVFAENCVGLSSPATTGTVHLLEHATVPSPPTAPLEIRTIGPNAVVIAWGIPEFDGGSPLLGYNIAIRDTKKTMWMEVGRVSVPVQKFTLRDLQEDHEYLIRIYARNEIGLSEPLESDEPFKVLPSTDGDAEEFKEVTDREPTSYSTTTTSWLRDNSMDADIYTYSRGKLLSKNEYFFRIWCYADELFS